MPTVNQADALDQQIEDALFANPHLCRHHVHVRTDLGHVVLQGRVKSFYAKQMAQESLRSIRGVERIDNELQVDWS